METIEKKYMAHISGNINAIDLGIFTSQEEAQEYAEREYIEFYDKENGETIEAFAVSR